MSHAQQPGVEVTLGELVAAVTSVTDDTALAAAVVNRFLASHAIRASEPRDRRLRRSPRG